MTANLTMSAASPKTTTQIFAADAAVVADSRTPHRARIGGNNIELPKRQTDKDQHDGNEDWPIGFEGRQLADPSPTDTQGQQHQRYYAAKRSDDRREHAGRVGDAPLTTFQQRGYRPT
jgi:hypothetical protein